MENSAPPAMHATQAPLPPPPAAVRAQVMPSVVPHVRLRLTKHPTDRSFGMTLEQRFVVAPDEYAAVVSFIFPHSAAARVGIQRGWLLQRINGQCVRGLSVKDVALMFRDYNEVDIEFDTQAFSSQTTPLAFSANVATAATTSSAATLTASVANGFASHSFRQASLVHRPIPAPLTSALPVVQPALEHPVERISPRITRPAPRVAAAAAAAAATPTLQGEAAQSLASGALDDTASQVPSPAMTDFHSSAVPVAQTLLTSAPAPPASSATHPSSSSLHDPTASVPAAEVVTPVTPAPDTPVAAAVLETPADTPNGLATSSTRQATFSSAVTTPARDSQSSSSTYLPQSAASSKSPVINRSASAVSAPGKKRARPIDPTSSSPPSSSNESPTAASPPQRAKSRSRKPSASRVNSLKTSPSSALSSPASAPHHATTAVTPTTPSSSTTADAETSPEQPNRRYSRRQSGGGKSTGRMRTSLTLERLVRMGFTREDAAASMAACGDNLDACMLWIVSHLEEKQYLNDLNQASIQSELSKRAEEKEHKELENETLKRAKEFTALFTTSFMLSNESEASQLKAMLAGAIGEVDPESGLRVVLTKLLKLEAQAIRWYRDASKCYLLQLAERLEASFAEHDVLQCCAKTSGCAFVELLHTEERSLSKALFDMPENHGGVPLAFLKADKDMQFSLDDDGFEVLEVEASDSD